MTRLRQDFTWGTLAGGFAVGDGVFRHNHPRYSRGGVTYVSSHKAIITADDRLPFDTPLRVLVPARTGDRRLENLTGEGLTAVNAPQFALGHLAAGHYAPFETHTGLFRQFAALGTEADVVDFANRYGPLGADLSLVVVDVAPDDPEKKGAVFYWAEPIGQWLAEAQQMANVIGLWDLIRDGADAFTGSHTAEAARLKIKAVTPEHKHLAQNWVLATARDNPAGYLLHSQTDRRAWPQLLLQQWIERGMRGRMNFGVSGPDLKATLTPNGLIGALWLQASLAIDGQVDFQQCRECSEWFGISAEHGRPEKLFCSDACRMRAYRKRKKTKSSQAQPEAAR